MPTALFCNDFSQLLLPYHECFCLKNYFISVAGGGGAAHPAGTLMGDNLIEKGHVTRQIKFHFTNS